MDARARGSAEATAEQLLTLTKVSTRSGLIKRSKLEFGRQIAVDFEADANFDERRGGPDHWSPPSNPGTTKA